jgi:hypothetical protein
VTEKEKQHEQEVELVVRFCEVREVLILLDRYIFCWYKDPPKHVRRYKARVIASLSLASA